MTIALLCPTRGRPQQFARMRDSVMRTSTTEPVIMSCTNGGSEDHYAGYRFPVDAPTSYMWNKLASWAMPNSDIKLFMLAADDIIFSTPGWDKALLDHYDALENKAHVYALRDSRDPDGAPHPICTREYIEAMGYFVPPIFLHWYIDTWTVGIADSNGVFTHLKDYLLTHDKPSDRGQPDATHLHIRSMDWHERDTYVNDTCQHFLEFEKQRLAKLMKRA